MVSSGECEARHSWDTRRWIVLLNKKERMIREDKNVVSKSLVRVVDQDAERKRRKSENVISWLHVQGWSTIWRDLRKNMSIQVTSLRKYQSNILKWNEINNFLRLYLLRLIDDELLSPVDWLIFVCLTASATLIRHDVEENGDNLCKYNVESVKVSPECLLVTGRTRTGKLHSRGQDKLSHDYHFTMMNRVNYLNVNGGNFKSNLRHSSAKRRRRRTISSPLKFITVALVARAAVKHHVNFLTFAIANNMMAKTLLPVVTERWVARRRGQRGRINPCSCCEEQQRKCVDSCPDESWKMVPVHRDPSEEKINCTRAKKPEEQSPTKAPYVNRPQIVIIQSTSTSHHHTGEKSRVEKASSEKKVDTVINEDVSSFFHQVGKEVMPDLPILFISSKPFNSSNVSPLVASNITSKIGER